MLVDIYRLFTLKEKLNKLFLSVATIELLSDVDVFRVEPIKEVVNSKECITGICILFEVKEDPHNRKIALRDKIKETMEEVIKDMGPLIIEETLKRVKQKSQVAVDNLLDLIYQETIDMKSNAPLDVMKEIVSGSNK